MPLPGTDMSARFESFWSTSTNPCLPGKNQFDAVGGRGGKGKIQTGVAGAKRVAGKICFDNSLHVTARVFAGSFSILFSGTFADGFCIGGCFRSEHCLNVSILALLHLEDRAAGLCRAQGPFYVLAVFALFGQSLAGANWFEVEAVNKFLRGTNFHSGK